MGRSKSLLVGLVATVAVGMALGLPAPAPAPAAEAPQVFMVDNEPDLTRWHFDPAQITVPAGTTVVWQNKGKEDHSVKADDGSFDSGLKSSGARFSRAFSKPGTYSYYCAPHPWMKGTVEVTAASAPSAPTPRTAAADNPNAAATSTTVAAPPPAAPAAPAPPPSPAPDAAAPDNDAGSPAAEGDEGGDGAASPAPEGSEDESAAPGSGSDSGDPLAGTLAIVLLPTLGALALGAKLRQKRS